jgi:predicted transcriptional regulator
MTGHVIYEIKDKVSVVKKLYRMGLNQQEIGVVTHLSQGTVSNIINGKYDND